MSGTKHIKTQLKEIKPGGYGGLTPRPSTQTVNY